MKSKSHLFPYLRYLVLLSSFLVSFYFGYASQKVDLLTPEAINLNKHWVLKDGILTPSKTPGGIIWSKESFGDFQISLDYKTSAKANSGLFFRTNPKNPVQGGFEIQIASPGLYSGKHVVGSLYDAKEPSKAAGKPDGEWNKMVLTCKGPSIQVNLNGVEVNKVDISKWKTPNKNPDGSKNKFKTALKDLPRKGHFGLQYHGQPVWFRNVKIVTLD
jgi:hypothetical protein